MTQVLIFTKFDASIFMMGVSIHAQIVITSDLKKLETIANSLFLMKRNKSPENPLPLHFIRATKVPAHISHVTDTGESVEVAQQWQQQEFYCFSLESPVSPQNLLHVDTKLLNPLC